MIDLCFYSFVYVFVKPWKQTQPAERVVLELSSLFISYVFDCHSIKSKSGVKGKGLIHAVDSNAQFGVFSYLLLKKIILPCRLIIFVHLNGFLTLKWHFASKAEEESISAESDVVVHHCWIHPNQFDGEGINYEFHLNSNCTKHNLDDLWKGVPLKICQNSKCIAWPQKVFRHVQFTHLMMTIKFCWKKLTPSWPMGVPELHP